MPASGQIGAWIAAGIVAIVALLFALDLGLFRCAPHKTSLKKALAWTSLWIGLALAFSAALAAWRGKEQALQFFAAYVIEFSLSLDNLFAFSLLFASFRTPPDLQHRVLLWGILGAALMRAILIFFGAAIIHAFNWILYLLGAFLVLSGLRWLFGSRPSVPTTEHIVVRLARKCFPVTAENESPPGRFIVMARGHLSLTPLALLLVLVEAADLAFAGDSIPAVFAVSQNALIVYSSNLFAILGLRSLYFVLVGAMRSFRHLHSGIAAVLIFIGAKMLISPWCNIGPSASLAGVAAIMAVALIASVARPDKNEIE